MSRKSLLIVIAFVAGLSLNFIVAGQSGTQKWQKWQKGTGWGWVWGKDDEVGALNEMTDATRLAAMRLAKRGKAYDLGISYDRTSYKWPGHSPGEVITFRSPEGAMALN